MSATWTAVARTVDVAGDGPHALAADGIDLVAIRVRGALRVFEGRCPHQGALLGEGELDGATLVCRNHRWRFDGATGKRDGGAQCLRACPAEERDGALHVDVTALRAGDAVVARRKIADLPGPKRRPLVGNALQVDLPRFHLQLERWAREFGPAYRVRFVDRDYVAVSDPALIEQALRDRPETYRRDSRVAPVFAELGSSGVFSADGAAWRPQRRLVMEALSQKNLRGFYPTLARVAGRLRARWERAAASGAVVDIQDDLMRFTVDVTTALAFGKELDTLDGGQDVIQRHLELILPAFARRLNALLPYWRLVRMPADRKVDRAVAALRLWIADLIREARARAAAAPDRPPGNFLESMLAARDEAGEPFAEEVIFGNVMTMLLAGEDTTANSLAWAVHLLCDHPAEVAALRAQLTTVLGDAPVPQDLARAGQLDVADAIATEAMRLLPVASLNFVQANRATVLGDIEIPKDAGVIVVARVPATDPARFVDPEVFRPVRHLAAGAAAGPHEAGALFPFGTGPRICPGRSLALLEMRVALATLYASFDVERVGEAREVTERYAFTIGPEHLRVRLRTRSGAAAHAGA